MKKYGLLFFVIIFCFNLFFAYSTAPEPRKIKALIVPHDVVAIKLAEDGINSIVADNPKTIILVGPNHTANGPKIASTCDGSTLYNQIGVNDELIKNEHSITNLIPIIEQYLPNSNIIPIIFQKGASYNIAKKVMETAFSEPDVIIVASIDFSHGLYTQDEQVNRAKMEEYIKSFDSSAIMGLDETYLDAPVVLAAILELLKDCSVDIAASTNAAEVLGMEIQDATGYLTVVFYENNY
ncbi:MAG TPA: AmmeMemoRadiSam system protein B [Oscillospiraceae bacterium]|nr:AmmeMemoRadiSam system protein B [Oscillospiraceae bacterium]HPS34731.1 AmmeMemoRadiSam system protein B [Oscillospiraceae bacterium]